MKLRSVALACAAFALPLAPAAAHANPSTHIDASGDVVTSTTINSSGARLQFKAVHVNAPMTQVGVLNGSMTIPSDPHVLGSLDQSAAIDDLIGTTVIAGHLSDRADKPGAFYYLTRAKRDDVITYITAQGRRLRFKVTTTATYPRSGRLPANLFRTTGPHRLVLISCTDEKISPNGHFHYTRNIVVIATPIP